MCGDTRPNTEDISKAAQGLPQSQFAPMSGHLRWIPAPQPQTHVMVWAARVGGNGATSVWAATGEAEPETMRATGIRGRQDRQPRPGEIRSPHGKKGNVEQLEAFPSLCPNIIELRHSLFWVQ